MCVKQALVEFVIADLVGLLEMLNHMPSVSKTPCCYCKYVYAYAS